ncbi:hypothetical protein P8C59_004769 [Phyllachora maydis]|uniref:Secreted protein n=1 Tax=Phyllachora maydis TaxID=1825666 RepID=A0AAD9I4A6_9PEZI|nr:hypothetical protein P8C59_004769 [Phyllachora maydis]
MLVKSLCVLAVSAFAGQVAAADEPRPYKLEPLHKMSIHDMFGVVRRQTPSGSNSGYQPAQSVCGDGNTCAEACGAGFETCASSDSAVHCYNPAVQQTCCPDKSGNSCDAGFYCTQDTAKNTWCCPNALDLAACAAAYTVTGGLVKETAPANPGGPANSGGPANPGGPAPAATNSDTRPVAAETPTPAPTHTATGSAMEPTGSPSSSKSTPVPQATKPTPSIPSLSPTASSSSEPDSAGNTVSATNSLSALVFLAGALLALV